MPRQKDAEKSGGEKNLLSGAAGCILFGIMGMGTLLLTGDGTMKTAGLIGAIAVCALVACQENEAVFTLVENEIKECCRGDFNRKYNEYLSISILVESVPKDKMKLQRLMIHHFLRMTSGVDTIQAQPKLELAVCTFIKSTPITRSYFTDRIEYAKHRGHLYNNAYADEIATFKTYIGTVSVMRCEEDAAKLKVRIRVSTGKPLEYNPRYAYEEKHILQNDCDPAWYESNKDNGLVKYYMELRNK